MKGGFIMANTRGRYSLGGRVIPKSQAGVILGRVYCMPQSTATNQFESLAKNFFRINPMATYYTDINTGVTYSRG